MWSIAMKGENERTISRKDAKAQRLANNNFCIFFATLAPLRLCVNCFCSFGVFTAIAVGDNPSALAGLGRAVREPPLREFAKPAVRNPS